MTITRGMGKEDVAMYIYTHTHTHTHTHKGVLLSHKKEGGNGICSNIHNLEMILLSDVHQTGKDKHRMISRTSGILKKRIQMNLSRKQTHGRREQTCVGQVGGDQGRDRLRIWGLEFAN